MPLDDEACVTVPVLGDNDPFAERIEGFDAQLRMVVMMRPFFDRSQSLANVVDKGCKTCHFVFSIY